MDRIEGLSIGLNLDTIKIESGLTDLKGKLRTVNSEMKANLSQFDRADKSIERHQTVLEGLNKKLSVQTAITDKAKKHYEKMVAEYGEGSKEAEKAAREFNNQSSSLQNLQRSVNRVADELKGMQEEQRVAASGWTKFGNAAEKAGDKISKIGSGMKGMGQSMSQYITAPLAGLGIASGMAAKNMEDSTIRIQNALGLTAEGAEYITGVARDIYKKGFGQSAEEIETALLSVRHNIKELDGEDLENVTQKALVLADTFDSDVGEVTRAANNLMIGFGLTSEKAFDLMAQGAQNGLNFSNEMFDNLSEYSTLFASMGFSAEEYFQLLQKGSAAGVYNLDYINDVMKEFQIRVKDGSKSTNDAMGQMSSETQKVWENFLIGEGTVKEVSNAVLGELGGMEDQVKANELGVALYGTKWEDLESDAMYALGGINGKLGEVDGSMDEMVSNVEESFGARFKGVMRGAQDALLPFGKVILDVAETMLPKVTSVIENISAGLNRMSPAAKVASVVFAGIAAAIGPVLAFIGMFVGAIGNIIAAMAPLAASIAKAGGLIKWLRLGLVAISGPIGIAIGVITALASGFILLYRNSDTFRAGVGKLIEKLKELGGRILDGLKTAVSAVADFFRGQMKVLQDFWNQNSDTIMTALKNIGKVVSVIFNGILAVIQFVMPAVLAIIQSIWNNIKGVIQGTLKIIMGVVQTFAGLLSGDFSKMWDGIKKIFSGALQLIWNGVQLMFWGKMLKGIVGLGKSLTSTFSSMWTSIRNTFSTVIKAIVDFVKNNFNTMKSGINTTFTGIRNFLTGIWNTIRTNIQNPVKAAVTFARNQFSSFRTKTVEIFSGIKDKVTGYVSDMVSAVKNMPGKMKDGLVKMSGKVAEGVTTVANKMAAGLGKGVNGVINGVNFVTDKLGIKTKIAEWDVPQYAKGTDGHPGGLALVGDGKGRNAGRELIQTPDGKTMLSPAKDTLVNLPKGTQVLSALETKGLLGNVPKYAKGVGGMIQSGLKKAKDFALNIWDYATDPGKLLNIALEKLGISKPDGSGVVGKVAQGGFNLVKDKAVGYVKSMFDKAEKEGGGSLQAPNFGGSFRRTSGFGPRWGRLHGGVDYAAPIGTPIPSQSGGVVSFASNGWNGGFGNLVKVRNGIYEHFYAHMSRIMTSVGQRVSKGSILGLVGSTGDSTGPHVHYELRKNGVRLNPGNVGFATGGLINNPGMYNLAEGGWPEYVIPTDPKRRTDAMKLLALAGKDIQGNKRPNQLPNPGAPSNDALLSAVMEQNKILLALLQSSQNIEKKPVLSQSDIGNAVARHNAKESSKRDVFSGRVSYV